jgi:hypothetical protein
VFACEDVTILIFVVPKGMELPFHDHPQMNVVGRVIYGKLRVTSCDLPDGMGGTTFRPWDKEPWAPEAECEILSEGDMFEIGPERKNVHHVFAEEETAFIDVTFPSYGSTGRNITYFESVMKDERRLLLHVAPDACGYCTDELPYRGPALM